MIGLALLAIGTAASADVVLVEEGKARATVVLPADPSPGYHFAAQELVDHIKIATGAALPVVEEGGAVTGVAIRIAESETELPTDGFEVSVASDGIQLAGSNPLGRLYAVYGFLEQEVGVRWLTPAENGTHVPQTETLAVSEGTREAAPSFRLRMFFARTDESALWALRNRINGIFPIEWAEKVDGDLAYLPPGIGRGIHSFTDLLPNEKHFADHPEYYPLINGERRTISIRTGQLCTSNPAVVDIVAARVKAYFDERPNARIFSVAPNDGKGWCECDNCRAVDEELGGGRTWSEDKSTPVTTDRLMDFLNKVAEAGLADHPDKTIVTLSYINYLPPPLTVKVDPRVMPLICHYAPACYAHKMDDATCEANAGFAKHLNGWVGQCPNAGVYAYTDKSMWYYFWRPVFRLMSHDIRFLHETGIRNYLAQSSAVRWEYSGPLYWATARLLWDPSRDIEGLISEWCEAMYGPASETMLTHYNTLEQAVLATGQHYRDHPATQAGGLYDMGWIAEAEKLLSDAEAAAGEGSVHAERIAAVRGRWLLSQACYDSVDQYRRYEESGDLADLEKVIQAAEMLAKRAGGGAWTPYSCRTVDELREELASGGITWKSFGQEETKGGRTCRNADETGRGDGAAGWATIHFLAPEGGATLAMAVWGESAGFTPVICSGGRGAGTAAGGVWSPIGTFTPTGKPEWQEVEFEIPETLYEPGVKRQMVGFGGADSQIWVAEVGVEAR